MTANGVIQLIVYIAVLLALAKPLGAYMARVYEGRPCGLDRALGWLERLVYRISGVRANETPLATPVSSCVMTATPVFD